MGVLFALSLAISTVLVYRFFIRHSTHTPQRSYTATWRELIVPTPQGAREALDNQPAHVIADVVNRTLNTPHPHSKPGEWGTPRNPTHHPGTPPPGGAHQ